MIGEISSEGINFKEAPEYGRKTGGKALGKLTFHQRALLLKKLAKYLIARKEEFYKLSYYTGATKTDSWIDFEGGIGTLFTYSGKGRRELPNETIWPEGDFEQLSKNGAFIGQHVYMPMRGIAGGFTIYRR